MDLNDFLLWIVGFACIASIVICSPAVGRHERGWAATCGVILGITGGLLYSFPSMAGLIGISLWLSFYLLPRWGNVLIKHESDRHRYHQAYRLALWLRWLHPWSGAWERPQLMLALARGQQGLEQATAVLTNSGSLSLRAQALLYTIQSDWNGCLAWLSQLPQQTRLKDPELAVCYLRTLGETGDLNGLLTEMARVQPYLSKRQVRLGCLYALAFCGRVEQVRRLLAGPLSLYPERIKRFWVGTAQMVAEQNDCGLTSLSSGDPVLEQAIAWRLSHSPAVPQQVLTDASKQILARLQIELRQDKINVMTHRDRQAYATYGLTGINLVAFGVEIQVGGSEDLNTLYRLGALVPQATWSGQWWRLLSANFLHYGWLHLLTNMLGLYFLGRPVELSLGVPRYLFVYLMSGVGAMFVFSLWAVNTEPAQVLVGASAAIMGLIGVIGAIFLRGWQREQSPLAAKRLRFIVLIIALQFAFDLVTPQVSFLSHLLGLILGFSFGLLLA
ncbi:MAG: rhomboid family intramembrane serine protease [Cyanophyceae cyanobacterium]